MFKNLIGISLQFVSLLAENMPFVLAAIALTSDTESISVADKIEGLFDIKFEPDFIERSLHYLQEGGVIVKHDDRHELTDYGLQLLARSHVKYSRLVTILDDMLESEDEDEDD